jgi:rod shape determining protein RodA
MGRYLSSPSTFAGSSDRRRSGVSSLLTGIDPFLVGMTLLLSSFGVLMIYSATRDTQRAAALDPKLYLAKQIVFIGIGLIAMFTVASIDYRRLIDLSPIMYAGSIVLLVGVLFAPAVNGAHGWFQLGQFQFQPAEFSKLVLIVALAAYGGAQRNELDGRRVRTMVGIAALPIFLIFLEPDLGGALVYGVTLLTVLWVAGAHRKHLLGLLALGIALSIFTIQLGILKGYQIRRLTMFFGSPDYSVKNSKIAIGSGGMTGRGLFAGAQTKFGFVPERHTDFIFSVVAEQLGIIGAALLLVGLGLLCWRILRIASQSRDTAGTLICAGVLAVFVFQIFENVGMTMQIMPVTGIPLPLISYGGSSTIMEFMAIGLVLNVNRNRFR